MPGLTFVGSVTTLEQVEGRDGTKYPGFYKVKLQSPDGAELEATANSHQKAEDGGELHGWWPILAGNVGTGQLVVVKGYTTGGDEVDDWGNKKKPKHRINGAKLHDGSAVPPVAQDGQQPAPPAQPAQQQAAPPAPQAQPPAAPTAQQQQYGHLLEIATVAVASVIPNMPQDITDDPDPQVRGAWIRHQAVKVLTLARMVAEGNLGPTPEELRAARDDAAKQQQPDPHPEPSDEAPAQQTTGTEVGDWSTPLPVSDRW